MGHASDPERAKCPTKSKTEKTAAKIKTAKETKPKSSRYVEGIGRRKTAVARVRVYPSEKKSDFLVNNLPLQDYFTIQRQLQSAIAPFSAVGTEFRTTTKVKGSGKNAQSEAVRLGLSRALIGVNKIWRSKLKKMGYLTRDQRKVERKKPGLRKARRPQQWRKR